MNMICALSTLFSYAFFIQLDTDIGVFNTLFSYNQFVNISVLYLSLFLSVSTRLHEDVCFHTHSLIQERQHNSLLKTSSTLNSSRSVTLSHCSPPARPPQPSLEPTGPLALHGEQGEGCKTLTQEIGLTPGNLREDPLPAQGFHDVSTLTGTGRGFVGVRLFSGCICLLYCQLYASLHLADTLPFKGILHCFLK